MFLIVIVNDSGTILTVKQGSWLIDENDDTLYRVVRMRNVNDRH